MNFRTNNIHHACGKFQKKLRVLAGKQISAGCREFLNHPASVGRGFPHTMGQAFVYLPCMLISLIYPTIEKDFLLCTYTVWIRVQWRCGLAVICLLVVPPSSYILGLFHVGLFVLKVVDCDCVQHFSRVVGVAEVIPNFVSVRYSKNKL